jgi:ribosome maturation factor RimP
MEGVLSRGLSMSALDRNRIDRLREIVEPVVRERSLEIFELALHPQGRRIRVSLTLDKREGFVTLEDCEAVARDVGSCLDDSDPIQGAYVLEVGSPGLDRPLRGPQDYSRFKGRKAKFLLLEPLAGMTYLVGSLGECGESDVEVMLEEGKGSRVPFLSVKSARLIVEF